ncbi:hypothetical protein [Nocardia barduliensis]|uniref:hypothetical protein n=1 Tax=Nocardia barduliensis TaxID=2736643 RepID=UPI001571DFCB|nr:hypothetical protein [Nocardia barduliensis]
MSTESERRLHTRADEDAARTGEPVGSHSDQYGDATDRRHEGHAEPVGDTAAVGRDTGQTASTIDDSEHRATSGDAFERDASGRVADDSGVVREHGAAGESATGAGRAEFAGDVERGSAATATQAVPQDVARESDGTSTAPAANDQLAPLIPETELDRLRTQWREVQVTFVDDPRAAVSRADELLGGTIEQLVTTYQERKRELDARLGDTSDTEGLRQALRGYRAFFDQLLSTGA